MKYVVDKNIREREAKHELSLMELELAKLAVEKLGVIETKKTAVNSSGIGVSDDFFKKKLGPRAVKQLTGELPLIIQYMYMLIIICLFSQVKDLIQRSSSSNMRYRSR